MYEASFRDNWELPAFSDYDTEVRFTFGEMAIEVARMHLLFEYLGVRKGDKVALTGKDCSRWAIAYMATITYGAVVVPILQDFHPNDIMHIINHSEASFLFVSNKIWESFDSEIPERLKAVLSLKDFSCISVSNGRRPSDVDAMADSLFDELYPLGYKPEDVRFPDIPNDTLVEINYTSGTTGFSKGVMLTANSLAGNVTYAQTLNLMFRGDEELCFLPLAHAYSCAFNLLTPVAVGAHVHILGKPPIPKILLKAFADIKPNLVITVPLILEKIYKKMILPQLHKRTMKLALSVPYIENLIYERICKKLIETMGGRFCEVIVGGAPMNQEVTDFLCKIKFPVTIGYGMTECGPLISYSNYKYFEPTSCGHVLRGIMDVRIDSADPYREVGEIQVRGENVMTGYYKNEEATRDAFTEDGWLRTGDLGTIDREKRIFIRGRNKTMILSSNGQNIYPEELEAKLNNMPFIHESLVLDRDGRIIALVYPDYEQLDGMGISHEDLPLLMEHNCQEVNKLLAPYEKISSIELYPTEFEKTPKKSIKRYLYAKY